MRLISSLAGIAAVNVANDDVGPTVGVLQKDIVDVVGNLYNMNVRPSIEPGVPAAALPVLQFQSGEFTSGNRKIPVGQILITSDGEAITAQDTDLADEILSDYMEKLDRLLGFRYLECGPKRLYQSTVVVEFDDRFVNNSQFVRVSEILCQAIGGTRGRTPYLIKRLAFGQNAVGALVSNPSITHFIPEDFVIERRGNEPFEKNRFFCTAPMPTRQHIEVLERIERSAID